MQAIRSESIYSQGYKVYHIVHVYILYARVKQGVVVVVVVIVVVGNLQCRQTICEGACSALHVAYHHSQR